MKPTVILLRNGQQKQYLNLLSILSLRLDGADATVVTNIDELAAPRMSETISRELRSRYNMVSIGADGVSTSHGTSSRSSRTAVLSAVDQQGTKHVVFQRGLRSLSVTDRLVLVTPTKGRSFTVPLNRPVTPEGHAALAQLGLA